MVSGETASPSPEPHDGRPTTSTRTTHLCTAEAIDLLSSFDYPMMAIMVDPTHAAAHDG